MHITFEGNRRNDRYEITEGSGNKVSVRNTTTGQLFQDFYRKECMFDMIYSGEVKVEYDSPSEPLSLKIEVDASPLDAALATAKELEATLLRIKGLLS